MANYDPELGGPTASGGVQAFVRRKLRSPRLFFVGLTVCGVLYYYADAFRPDLPPGIVEHPHPPPPAHSDAGPWYSGSDDDRLAAKLKKPKPKPLEEYTSEQQEYVVDEYGDHYYPHILSPDAAPMFPEPDTLLDPAELFPEVGPEFLQRPVVDPFSDADMYKITSEAPVDYRKHKQVKIPAGAFSNLWEGPEEWKPTYGGARPVQWEGFKKGGYETDDQRKVREARRDAVKRGFVYAWQKYKDHAWGHDEVKPVTKASADPFNGWGASIVDTLDTLLVMGLSDEYNLCRPHVNQLNFRWVKGMDWSQGYIAPANELDPSGKPWQILRESVSIPVFETGIRYLGGLLGAYDLSGDKLMLDRAVEIAEVLSRAFNTSSGLPSGSRMDPGYQTGALKLHSVSVAEVGSMTLELMRLGFLTNDRKWFDLAQRCTDYLATEIAPRTKYPPLIPMSFVADPLPGAKIQGSYSFGAMADSFYEYLIKTVKLLGETSALAKQYALLYADSVDAARKIFFYDIPNVPGRDLLALGKYEFGQHKQEVEHLSCFAGGMLGLGDRLLDRPEDFKDGERFTSTCYWIGASTPMGVQPENVQFFAWNETLRFENVTMDGTRHRPPLRLPLEDHADARYVHKNWRGEWYWNDDGSKVDLDAEEERGPVAYHRQLRGTPPATKKQNGHYINRPETIESVFYMYRLTGDRKWQDVGWDMFTHWATHAKAPAGLSDIRDVTQQPEKKVLGDNMESFIFAETFKYHYLLQSEPDLLSLDNYVLNTEAHPLIATDKEPGFEGLWTPPKEGEDQNLGERGQGTHVQKFMRLENLAKHRKAMFAAEEARKKAAAMRVDGEGGEFRKNVL